MIAIFLFSVVRAVFAGVPGRSRCIRTVLCAASDAEAETEKQQSAIARRKYWLTRVPDTKLIQPLVIHRTTLPQIKVLLISGLGMQPQFLPLDG